MAVLVAIVGESGSGKSTSMRNFRNDECGVINVGRKPLPFRSSLKTFNSDNYAEIMNVIGKSTVKSIVVDDAQYLMANEFMRSAKTQGYQKFTDLALNFWSLLQYAARLPDDKIIYFMMHIERDASGNEKMKTIGKMLDEKITLEGLFTIVLKTSVKDGKYQFVTQTNGADTTKSPMGMFNELYIDNDLKMVDDTIREYYGIQNQNNNGGNEQ